MLAAKILGEDHLGLADLVREYFGDELKKENQRADWTTRPLPLEMCEYAIHDTFYLHELCAILVEKLQEAGRMSWLTEQCDALIEHAKHPAPQRKDPWRVTGSAPLSPCALNVLKFLWEWRENQAQELDRPPYKVMPVELMLAIARRSEANFPTVDLEKLPKLPRNFRDERLDSFVNMLQTAVAVAAIGLARKTPQGPAPAGGAELRPAFGAQDLARPCPRRWCRTPTCFRCSRPGATLKPKNWSLTRHSWPTRRSSFGLPLRVTCPGRPATKRRTS